MKSDKHTVKMMNKIDELVEQLDDLYKSGKMSKEVEKQYKSWHYICFGFKVKSKR